MPIHNGTFDLGLYAWNAPFERIQALAVKANVLLATPPMGAPLNLLDPVGNTPWRQSLKGNWISVFSFKKQIPGRFLQDLL